MGSYDGILKKHCSYWGNALKQKMDELFTSRRYNLTPLLRSSPGGLEGACRMTLIRLQKY